MYKRQSTSDTVSVERRSRDQKLDLNLPAGASATAFGHEIGAAPVHGVKAVSYTHLFVTGNFRRKIFYIR